MIRAISKKDSPIIAKIHMQSLSDDFLPSLGVDFLSAFYQGVIGRPKVFGFLDTQKGKISGFVVGTSNMELFFKDTISSNFISLFYHLLLALIKKPSIIKNVAETLFYTAKDRGPVAELVIIAVDNRFRGKGIGKKLVLALEEEMKKRKIKGYKLTVTKRNKAANEFYKSIGFKQFSEFELYNKSWNIITKRI